MLGQDIIKKMQIDENNVIKLDVGENNRKYKVVAICNNMVYAKKSVGHLPKIYHLVF